VNPSTLIDPQPTDEVNGSAVTAPDRDRHGCDEDDRHRHEQRTQRSQLGV